MNLKTNVVCVLLYVCYLGDNFIQGDPFCVPDTGAGADFGPEIKIPKQFYFHLEATFADKSKTTSFTEYYDGIGSRGMIHESEAGITADMYFDYATNEIFIITNNNCTTSDLRTNPNSPIMGFDQNNKAHIYSGARLLFLEHKGKYMGSESVVRGISCFYWRSCQTWDHFDATMWVDWYFEVTDIWDGAGQESVVPVRCDVNGVAGGTPFHHVYDFFHFRSGLPDDQTVFETPAGIYCPNRKQAKLLPQPPETMSFYTEIVTHRYPLVVTMKEDFDRLSYLARFSYTALPLYSKFSKNPIVEIHDFMTGIAYVTDTVTGDCMIREIPHTALDTTELNPHDVRMASAKDFFDFPKDKYFYEGIRTVRNVNSSTWIGIRNDWPKNNSQQSIWEWYISLDTSTDVMGGVAEHFSPIQFRISLSHEQYDFNIFDFSLSQPKLTSYDVSACYRNRNREKFGIGITELSSVLIKSNVEIFKFYLISSLVDALGIRPLRIQNIKVIFGDLEVFVLFEITDVAPIIGDIQKPLKEVPFTDAINKLNKMLNNDEFIITLYQGETPIGIRPKPVKVEDVLYKVIPPKLTVSYTAGSMTGLGFGMTLLGLLFAGLFIFYRSR